MDLSKKWAYNWKPSVGVDVFYVNGRITSIDDEGNTILHNIDGEALPGDSFLRSGSDFNLVPLQSTPKNPQIPRTIVVLDQDGVEMDRHEIGR